MKRSIGAIVIGLVLLLGVTPSALASQGSAKAYKSCAALLKKYPGGVAKSKALALRAVDNGYESPKVSASLYRVNGKRLDRDKDGVMCEQSAAEGQTAEVSASEEPVVWSLENTETWSEAERDFPFYQTSKMKGIARADLLWICTRLADSAMDDFTRGFYDDRADEGVRLFNIDRSHARQIVWQYWDGWCHTMFYLHARNV